MTVSFGHRCLLFSNSWALRSHFGIQFFVSSPVCWQVIFMEDRFYWTFRNARFAVNTFVWMNEENSFAFIEALHRTHNHTIRVLTVEARLCNNMSHLSPFHTRHLAKQKPPINSDSELETKTVLFLHTTRWIQELNHSLFMNRESYSETASCHDSIKLPDVG